ncbi:MAG: methyltransferase domain-containing protein [Xanthomonadales bacterium]|nr:methyltransferase domain-containing protein [Xanthomonadales bacterium]
MSLFDRASIRRNFSRAARDYDRAASAPARGGRAAAREPGTARAAAGSGAGPGLRHRPPHQGAQAPLPAGAGGGARPRRGDAPDGGAAAVRGGGASGWFRATPPPPPFADGAFDLVLANLLLQWCEDPLRLFAEVRRILAPGGLFLFSSFGPETLAELRAAFAAPERHLSPFPPPEALGAALLATGLRHPVLERELRWRRYRDFAELAAELRALGARNALSARPRGLGGRRELAEARRRFEQARDPSGTIPVRWELVLGLAFAPAPREATPGPRGGIALVPADRIPVRGRREGA